MPASITSITSITLERNCFGCANGGVLRLQREGLSSVTQTGHARHGTSDSVRQGRMARADFDALARLLQARGFFALQEIYQDPDLQDGPWSRITVVRDGQEHQVFSREDAGPAKLRAMERAIDAAAARIRFEAAPPPAPR